jgi:PAS domain S-box-containing protein
MGMYYINRFWSEIDDGVSEKLIIPRVLMEQRALNFDAVTDFSALEEIVQEEVHDAFIAKSDGKIFYSNDPSRIGKHFTLFLDNNDPLRTQDHDISKNYTSTFTSDDNNTYISVQSPLVVGNRLLGLLFITIDSEKIQREKTNILLMLLLGSAVTIILTTLLEALLVHWIFVPRIKRTSTALQKVEDGDLTIRIAPKGTMDEIGVLIEQINSMISAIEQNTKNLQLLNKGGEAFTQASCSAEVEDIFYQIMQEHFGGSLSKDDSDILGYLASSSINKSEFERKIVSIFPEDIRTNMPGSNWEFCRALSRLRSSALKREKLILQTKEAEEEYRQLFSSAQEGIFKTTLKGKLLIGNPSLLRMFGHGVDEKSVEKCLNINFLDYLSKKDQARVCKEINNTGTIHDFEVQFRRQDGSTFWASLSAHVPEEKNEKEQAVEGRIVDISERIQREKVEREKQVADAANKAQVELLHVLEQKNKQLQKTLTELNAAQKQLVQSEKMTVVGLTVGGVAHDLNNILSGVVSYPELLLLRLPEESEFREPLKTIMASGKKAAAVVDDLLTLSRNVAKKNTVISLNSLIEDYLQSGEFEHVRSVFPHVHVSTSFKDDLFPVNCSTVHIEKVVMNLVINAMEAIKTSGTIQITTENISSVHGKNLPPALPPGDYAVLKIIDDGPGISDEDINHVFEPFYTKKVMGRSGTGLGLTVVWNALEEHGGTITVDSQKHGTVFTVYLPASEIEVSTCDETIPLDKLKGKGSILIIDDEELQRHLTTSMLVQFGYTVNSVSSGEAALDYLQKHPTDLLVLDMIMPPGMNGRETYEKILQMYPGQKAIIASGFSYNEDIQKTLQLGAQHFLKKPYYMEELGKAVREVLFS